MQTIDTKQEFDQFFTRLLSLPDNSAFDLDVLLSSKKELERNWQEIDLADAAKSLRLAARKIPRNAKMPLARGDHTDLRDACDELLGAIGASQSN